MVRCIGDLGTENMVYLQMLLKTTPLTYVHSPD